MTKKELKLLRLYLGLSQKQFAKQVGVGESTIAKAEAGIVDVTEFIEARVKRKYDLLDDGFVEFKNRMES